MFHQERRSGALRTRSNGTSSSYWASPIRTRKRTSVEAVLTAMNHQLAAAISDAHKHRQH